MILLRIIKCNVSSYLIACFPHLSPRILILFLYCKINGNNKSKTVLTINCCDLSNVPLPVRCGLS